MYDDRLSQVAAAAAAAAVKAYTGYCCIESIRQTSTSVIITLVRWRDSRRATKPRLRSMVRTNVSDQSPPGRLQPLATLIQRRSTSTLLILSNHRVTRGL